VSEGERPASGSRAADTPAGNQARVSVAVAVPPDVAFDLFTNHIDQWWRRGPAFRHFTQPGGLIRLEGGVGGRVFESVGGAHGGGASGGMSGAGKPGSDAALRAAAARDADTGERVFEVGRIEVWEPPSRLVFTWKNATFAESDRSEVEVTFAATSRGTLVTVTHRGWASLRPDHPARHGLATDAFIRSVALWWGQLMTSLRELSESDD
jgi:uncharacterized protein YndB with AHSA1/START domain